MLAREHGCRQAVKRNRTPRPVVGGESKEARIHSNHVGVDDGRALAAGKASHRIFDVMVDTGYGSSPDGRPRRSADCSHDVSGPPRQPYWLEEGEELFIGSLSCGLERWIGSHELPPHSLSLFRPCALHHHLRQEHLVWVCRVSPCEVPPMLVIPGQEASAHPLPHLGRGDRVLPFRESRGRGRALRQFSAPPGRQRSSRTVCMPACRKLQS